MANRDFAAELQAARKAEDWDACARIWEERRVADVDADEASLHGNVSPEDEAAFQDYLDSESHPALIAMELANDRGPIPYSPEAFDEMVRHDLEGRQ